MESLNAEFLDEIVSAGYSVRFQAQGGSMKTNAMCTDKFGDKCVTGIGSSKQLALADCHSKWLEHCKPAPKAKPKAKAASVKKAASAEKED